MTRVEIPVEAKLNAADLDAELKQLTQKINSLGASIAQANKVKFNPIGKATLDDLKRVQTEFDKLKRTSPLGSDISRTGQGKKSFFDLDWNAISSNGVSREARRYGAFNRIVGGTGASFTQGAPVPGKGGGSGGGGGAPSAPSGGGSAWAKAGRKIVGSGLKAAGPVGGAADEAVGAGISGGVMAGVAGLIGGVVALGVGKLVGGVMSKIGDAQNDSIGYDTLKRTLGDVNVSFSVLQRSMHAASDAFDGTYQQTLKMGGEFARISGMSGKGSELALSKEVAVGGGFGRSFGMDPEQSNGFFAQMRQFGVTSNDRDSQRLAVYVGEAIAKSGAFAKSDEMLQAIASYTTQQTRMGLSSANVGDYTATLAGMVGAHVPGMDVMGAAGILSRVNSSIASGGNAGEAGQNYMYTTVGRKLGLDPIMGAALREQGAFGTGAQEFGSGSVMAKWAVQNGVSIPGSASGSNATTMSMIMSGLHNTYAKSPELRLSAMSNLFGVNTNQAAFLDGMKPEQMGDVMNALTKAGIDPSKLNPTSISSLAQIQLGSRSDLGGMSKDIWGKLNEGERASLDKAGQSGSTEDMRGELLKDYAKYGQADTEGEQTRNTIQALDKDMTDAAGKMITPLNDMRQILLYAFGDRGKMSAADITKANYDARADEIKKKRDATVADAESQHMYGIAPGVAGKPNLGDEDPSIAAKNKVAIAVATSNADFLQSIELAKLKAEMYPADKTAAASPGSSAATPGWMDGGGASAGAGGGGGGGSAGPSEAVKAAFRAKYGDLAAQISAQTGNDPDMILAQLAKETGWGKHEGAGNNPFNITKSTNWAGATITRGDKDKNGNPITQQFKAYGGEAEAASDYVSTLKRVDPGAVGAGNDINKFTAGLSAGGYATDPSYASGIKSAYAALKGTPMPDAGSSSTGTAGAGGSQDYNFNHNITLQYPNGQPAASPFSINTSFGGPTPFGN